MDEGDINAFYGADGELYYQRWDGEQWSPPARMMMESIEVLTLKSRVTRLEETIESIIEASAGLTFDDPAKRLFFALVEAQKVLNEGKRDA